MEESRRLDNNWRRKWLVAGATPYYYHYPNYLHGPLRVSYYTSTLEYGLFFLWFMFILSFVLWWWIDWFLYIGIIFIVFIVIIWIGMYLFLSYMESESKQKKEDTDKDMKPATVKTSQELKSLKMQL